MYELTLTPEDRNQIDAVGDRKDHGDNFWLDLVSLKAEDYTVRWEEDEDITFKMEDYEAMDIRDRLWKCEFEGFSDELKEKIKTFLMSVE